MKVLRKDEVETDQRRPEAGRKQTAAARHSIDSWQKELEGYDGATFQQIAKDLGRLHSELSKGEIDGAKVSKLLHKLGTDTTDIAKHAGDKSSEVKQLGGLIVRAAGQLDR